MELSVGVSCLCAFVHVLLPQCMLTGFGDDVVAKCISIWGHSAVSSHDTEDMKAVQGLEKQRKPLFRFIATIINNLSPFLTIESPTAASTNVHK